MHLFMGNGSSPGDDNGGKLGKGKKPSKRKPLDQTPSLSGEGGIPLGEMHGITADGGPKNPPSRPKEN